MLQSIYLLMNNKGLKKFLKEFLTNDAVILTDLVQELIQRPLLDKVSNEKYISWLYSKLWKEETTCKKESICHVSEFAEMLFA